MTEHIKLEDKNVTVSLQKDIRGEDYLYVGIFGDVAQEYAIKLGKKQVLVIGEKTVNL